MIWCFLFLYFFYTTCFGIWFLCDEIQLGDTPDDGKKQMPKHVV
jgi:hypothetical protein